jgi:hypothetical protein
MPIAPKSPESPKKRKSASRTKLRLDSNGDLHDYDRRRSTVEQKNTIGLRRRRLRDYNNGSGGSLMTA